MSEHIEGISRNQTALFPQTLEEYIEQDNPARFINAFVDSLNLEKLGFKHAQPSYVGRPSYDPKDSLKLYRYGYLNQSRSSRKLERECHRNIEVMWLIKKLAPDFKTITDFRKDSIECVKSVFKEFVKLCIDLDLYGANTVAIDGTKFKAANSLDKNFNCKKLAYRLDLIDRHILEHLAQLEEQDYKEQQTDSKHIKTLQEKVHKLMKRKEQNTQRLAKLKESKQG